MKAIVSLSGGMDSATVLALALEKGREVLAVGFTYGSKHNRYENEAARKIAEHYAVSFRLLDLTPIMGEFRSDLLLSGGEVPEGHYAEEAMRRTVVPFRNGIFCSILAGIAGSVEAGELWLGVHAGDHFIYPDCRPEFVLHMETAIRKGLDRDEFRLKTPFLQCTKQDILHAGFNMKRQVPYELTRTCYKDQMPACGKCGSCRERLEAFQLLGKADPIEYVEGV